MAKVARANNAIQVYINASDNFNSWDDGKEGNYWSDYLEMYPNATELDGFGVWNTPYVINENNQDNYPIIPEITYLIPLPLFMTTILLATLIATITYRRKRAR